MIALSINLFGRVVNRAIGGYCWGKPARIITLLCLSLILYYIPVYFLYLKSKTISFLLFIM